jgi:hypothetical protein
LNLYEIPRKVNRFYELFLIDYNGNFIDVPILIDNVVGPQGDTPNREQDTSRWILTRRFFLYDTISSITVDDWGKATPIPQVIRYAKTFTLKVNLDINNAEMINVPYL